jgi:hypothetical protein
MLFLMVSTVSNAQGRKPIDPYGEIGLTIGQSYYIGDINPRKHLGANRELGYGALYRFNLTKRHAIRLQGLRINLEANDADSDDLDQVNRNLNFRNKITELSLLLEINFYEYKLGRIGEGFTPYVFGGLAYFNMNPETEFNGNYYELIDMRTEGQGSPGGAKAYKSGQIAIPFGIGIKAGLSKRVALNLEWGMRRTFTDYIDDVSGFYADPSEIRNETGIQLAADLADPSFQTIGPDGDNVGMLRGNPNDRDWYIYTGLVLSVRLGKDSRGCWK